VASVSIVMSRAAGRASATPLIAHIIHRLDVGGLENGLVNLINRIPPSRYRHAIICMTGHTDFAKRIHNPNVELHALGKREGQDWAVYRRLWRLLRSLKPDIVHTRNLATLEGQAVAALVGVPVRIHGEHGRDIIDISGANKKHLMLRRLLRHFVTRYIALSNDLEGWLQEQVHVPAAKIVQIYNGVDTERFHPAAAGRGALPPAGFASGDELVIGTVGQMRGEKDQLTLARAFIELLNLDAKIADKLRLVMIGDGPLRAEAMQLLRKAGVDHLAWLPGVRDDVDEIMRGFDIFVLPSLIEGVSNTILEAMATGLPVVATDVGGNTELVVEGETGALVPSSNPAAMADALSTYIQDQALMRRHGRAGRKRVEQEFSMDNMVTHYLAVYDSHLQKQTALILAQRNNK